MVMDTRCVQIIFFFTCNYFYCVTRPALSLSWVLLSLLFYVTPYTNKSGLLIRILHHQNKSQVCRSQFSFLMIFRCENVNLSVRLANQVENASLFHEIFEGKK